MTRTEIMEAVERLEAARLALKKQFRYRSSRVRQGRSTDLTAVWALRLMALGAAEVQMEHPQIEHPRVIRELLDLADSIAEGLGEAGKSV